MNIFFSELKEGWNSIFSNKQTLILFTTLKKIIFTVQLAVQMTW